MGVGATVTVSGIVTNGGELGSIRYMQDDSGGLAVYSSKLSAVQRGDMITVTGVLKDYNTLLEMDPVNTLTINSSGNPLPAPIVLTPAQLSESYEGMLVKLQNVVFDGSGTFERMSYTFTAGGEGGQIYINSAGSPLIGTVIPTGPVTLTAPLGVYNGTYQLLPRDLDDLVSSSAINLTGIPQLSNLTTSGFTVAWTTDNAGTTEALYGNSPALELGALSVPGEATEHGIDLTGLQPSEIIYFQPFSVKGSDTARSALQVYITQSGSTGAMRAFFNNSVDPSVSLGLMEAGYLDHAIDDTLIAYIDRARESIDFTIYNFNNAGISNISNALNAAHDRGVVVRVVYDSNTDAVGVQSLVPGIGKIASPPSQFPLYGIMHNKFVVFDANSADPDQPVVWTGATNFTDGQINRDPNNVVVIQDKSLALAFRLEFNEMFGSSGDQPDGAVSRFGSLKTDNTPHDFVIGGKKVECYFSPSDGTHGRILETIQTADHSLHIATMLITKTDIGYSLADKNDAGLDVKVLINGFDQYGEPIVNTLKASLQEDIRLPGEPGIMHHKYMIVDQGFAESDPILLTGSHNWSSSAQFRNDENTLVIHDQGMANAFYQEFVVRFSHGDVLVESPACKNDFVTMTEGSSFTHEVLLNDELPGTVSLSISRLPKNGTARVEGDQTITYIPGPAFNQDIDTIGYRVCLESAPSLCDSAFMVVYVNRPVGVEEETPGWNLSLYPNPAGEFFHITAGSSLISRVELIDRSGRVIRGLERAGVNETEILVGDLAPGIYFVRITLRGEGSFMKKIAVK